MDDLSSRSNHIGGYRLQCKKLGSDVVVSISVKETQDWSLLFFIIIIRDGNVCDPVFGGE